MALPAPSPEVVMLVREEFGLNEQRIKEAVTMIQEWLRLQPHLPDEYDDAMIERWIIRCKNRLEIVKQSLDTYFTLKTAMPELLNGYSTHLKWFRRAYDNLVFFPLPELTSRRERVILWAIRTKDPSNYFITELVIIALMIIHVRMREEYCSSDIYILDLSNFTLGHVKRINFGIFKQLQVCIFKAFQLRLSSFHVINMPPYAEFFRSWVKMLVKEKLLSKVHFHGEDWSELYDFVPRHILPEEIGGTAGTIAQISDNWREKLETYNDWYSQNDQFKSDETKRPGGEINTSELLGVEGSFRKLEID